MPHSSASHRNSEVRVGLKMALLCQGNIPAAEAALRRSTELDPLSASDYARLAYLHYVKGDHRSAAGHLEKSFALDRDYPEALFYKGLLHFQLQDYDSAVECLRLARFPLEMGLLAAAYARQGNRPQAPFAPTANFGICRVRPGEF